VYRDPPLFRLALLAIPQLLTLLSTCIASLAVALLSSWSLALVLLSLVPLHYLLLLLLSRAAKGSAKAGLEATHASSRHATEVFTHLRAVFALDGQSQASARFESLLRASQSLHERTAHLTAFSRSLFGFLLLSLFSLGAWYAGTVVLNGATAGRVLSCFICAVLGGAAAQRFRASWAELGNGRRAGRGPMDGIAAAGFEGDLGGFRPAPSPMGARSVYLDGVTIPPRGSAEGLDGLSLSLQAGSTNAFAGTDAEFTALAEVLLRLRGTEGQAEMDGVTLAEYDPPFVRRHVVGIAGRGYPVLSGSVGDAVVDGRAGGMEGPSDAEVWSVLEQVGLAEAVKGCPAGLQTSVWVLSEGERQRWVWYFRRTCFRRIVDGKSHPQAGSGEGAL